MHTTGGDDYSTFKFAAPKISDVLFRRASTPVEEFSFSKPASILDAESPQKRRRVYKKKRSKGSSTTRRNGARQSVEKQTLPLTQNYDSANEDGFDGDEDTGDDTLFRQMSITRENVDGFQVDDGYVEFEERLTWDDMMFTRITAKVFVVTGWSMKDKTTTDKMYHLIRTRTGHTVTILCLCPSWSAMHECFHARFLNENGEKFFPVTDENPEDERRTCLFGRTQTQLLGQEIYVNLFSVPTVGRGPIASVKDRAIVRHEGSDDGEGDWKCSLCKKAIKCQHITVSRRHFKQLLANDVHVADSLDDDTTVEYSSASLAIGRTTETNSLGVSYKTIPPPEWTRIDSDPAFAYPPVLTSPPDVLKISDDSLCRCGLAFDRSKKTEKQPCIIFTLTQAWTSQIEVQKCSVCRRGTVGPDCGDIGMYNFNNKLLFTHELLNDYTSNYTTSETPFAAWVTVITRRYKDRQSEIAFVSDNTFRAVWFEYAKLLSLDGDMLCPVCGPSPEVVIADGVTLAFHQKHLLASIKPPTVVDSDALRKPSVKPITNGQCLLDSGLRKDIRKVLTGSLAMPKNNQATGMFDDGGDHAEVDGGESSTRPSVAFDRRRMAWLERYDLIPGVITRLKEVESSLGSLFETHYSQTAVLQKAAPEAYSDFFLQASVAQEENVLQLVNETALGTLLEFLQYPSHASASMLLMIPSYYSIVLMELDVILHDKMNSDIWKIGKWIYKRAFAVKNIICRYGAPEANYTGPEDNDDWKKTGACYSLPQVRQRPAYPAFSNDSGADNPRVEQRGDGCNKFYSRYGESRLTGGLMCLWCTHSICYGFHCIPSAEGRNDVFSALYTRWVDPPKMIVYDFACALQPYCIAREPEFFAKTLFVIDDFHAKGHTKCGKAAFLKTYAAANPLLKAVNSSAAECGNSSIVRIRKSVGYMSQTRAILFTKVFISIWNRQKIQRLKEQRRKC